MAIAIHLKSRLLTAAVALVAGGCAHFEPTAERYVPPPVGTTWERMQTNTGNYGSQSALAYHQFRQTGQLSRERTRWREES